MGFLLTLWTLLHVAINIPKWITFYNNSRLLKARTITKNCCIPLQWSRKYHIRFKIYPRRSSFTRVQYLLARLSISFSYTTKISRILKRNKIFQEFSSQIWHFQNLSIIGLDYLKSALRCLITLPSSNNL